MQLPEIQKAIVMSLGFWARPATSPLNRAATAYDANPSIVRSRLARARKLL
jgi:hypothetical protein